MSNVVSTLASSSMIGSSSSLKESSSFLQVRRTTIKTWMSSNFGGISQLTVELPAIERLKIDVYSC